jgi:hypothetical protein
MRSRIQHLLEPEMKRWRSSVAVLDSRPLAGVLVGLALTLGGAWVLAFATVAVG